MPLAKLSLTQALRAQAVEDRRKCNEVVFLLFLI